MESPQLGFDEVCAHAVARELVTVEQVRLYNRLETEAARLYPSP